MASVVEKEINIFTQQKSNPDLINGNNQSPSGSGSITHSSTSSSSSSFSTTFFGLLNEEQVSNYLTNLRCPSSSSTINILIFSFYFAILPLGNMFAWLERSQEMEGYIASFFDKIITLTYSLGISYMPSDLQGILLILVFLYEVLLVLAFGFGYNALLRGFFLFFFVIDFRFVKIDNILFRF